MRLRNRLAQRAGARAPALSPLRALRADILADELAAIPGRRLALDGFALARFADRGLLGPGLDQAVDDLLASGRARLVPDHRLALVVVELIGAQP